MPFLNVFVLLESFLLLAIGILYTLRLQKQEKELKLQEKQLHSSAETLMQEAQSQAQSILKHALTKAEELVDKTDFFQENIQSKLQSTLKEKSTDVSKSFDTMTGKLKEEYLAEIQDAFKTLEDQSKKNMQEFQVLLKNEGLSRKTFIDKKLDEEFDIAKNEVAEFKKLKMEEIEKKIEARVNELAMQVLGKSISFKDQEKLIMEAIEKGKKEGLFQ